MGDIQGKIVVQKRTTIHCGYGIRIEIYALILLVKERFFCGLGVTSGQYGKSLEPIREERLKEWKQLDLMN